MLDVSNQNTRTNAIDVSPLTIGNEMMQSTGGFPVQSGGLVIEVPVILEGRDVARGTYKYTTEYQDREANRNSAF